MRHAAQRGATPISDLVSVSGGAQALARPFGDPAGTRMNQFTTKCAWMEKTTAFRLLSKS